MKYIHVYMCSPLIKTKLFLSFFFQIKVYGGGGGGGGGFGTGADENLTISSPNLKIFIS